MNLQQQLVKSKQVHMMSGLMLHHKRSSCSPIILL